MGHLKEVVFNYYLLAAFAGWFVAQIVKVFTGAFKNRKKTLRALLFGTGGMPSSHTAACAAVCVSCILQDGSSAATAISVLLLFIVMVDASGVRRVTGQQSEVLNATVKALREEGADIPEEDPLREMVGHTPLQVLVGCIVGIAVGILLHFVFKFA